MVDRLGPLRAAATLAVLCAVASTPAPALARDSAGGLALLLGAGAGAGGGADAVGTAQAGDAPLDLETPPLASPTRSPALAALTSVGVTAGGLMLGALVVATSRDFAPAILLGGAAAVVGPSLGQFYLERYGWGAALAGARLLAVGLVAYSVTSSDYWDSDLGQVGLVAWAALALFDVVNQLSVRPPSTSTALSVTPWLGEGGGGLALAGRLP